MLGLRHTPQLLLAGTILLGSTARGTSGAIDDTYDDLPAAFAVGIPQIGAYHGLVYGGWAVAGNGSDLKPHSGDQAAVAVTTLTAATGNPGTVSIGVGLKCFDLESFYFGCALLSLGPMPFPARPCIISVSGYRGSTMVGSVPFDYGTPSNPLDAGMLLADLSADANYKCITNVTLAISSGLDVLLLIDDFVHKNHAR